ncbi:MAG: hypothetical protein RLZZ196_2619 [Bacteroidota bacterium]|jgi:hypothetical protein
MTSVEWLFNKLWEEPKDKFAWHSIFEQAKEMHKQEIIDARDSFVNEFNRSIDELFLKGETQTKKMTSEQYYNEIFNSELPNASNYCDCEPQTYYQWEMEENKCNKCNKKIYTEEHIQSLKQPK